MKTKISKSEIKLLIVLSVVLLIPGTFVGLSYLSHAKSNRANLVIDFAGIKDVIEDTSGWGWIKSGAIILSAAHATVQGIYTSMEKYGMHPNLPFIYDGWLAGSQFTAHIRTKNASKPIPSTVDSAGVTYRNRVSFVNDYIKKASLQLFFDDPEDASVGKGYLLIAKPYYFESIPGTIYSETGIFETRAINSGTHKVMYISFSGSPWKQTGHTYPVSGRIKMVYDGSRFSVTGLIYTYVDGSKGFTTCRSGAGYSFYTFAYMAYDKSPYFTTSLRGWDDFSVSDKTCGVNRYNYGHSNVTSGLVCDAQSTSCPDGTPYPLNEDVYTLYSGMNNTIAQEYQEQAIKGLSISFVDSLTFD